MRDTLQAIDFRRKTATLVCGATIRWDKLVLSPGMELDFDRIAGLRVGAGGLPCGTEAQEILGRATECHEVVEAWINSKDPNLRR